MDEIDITSSDFSLDVPYIADNIAETITVEGGEDYTMYMYIGIFIFILATGWVVYNYTLKKKRVTFQDKLDECYGGNESSGGEKCYNGVCDRA
jgi:hypothetical protein